jgi:hypothetical protein
MSEAPEQFEELRRLLSLKRHEQPPPGFFNNFSASVIAGIRSEPEPALLDRLWDEAPWLKRIFTMLETNPLAAGAFVTTICALLVGGIVYSQYVDQSPQLLTVNSDGSLHLPDNSGSLASAKTGDLFTGGNSASNYYSSSASVAPAAFDPFKAPGVTPKITPVDFTPGAPAQ